MKLAVNNPNLSLIMPVGCNANCDFCYWEEKQGLTMERFDFIVNSLPEIFKQCSITGGEPTLSKQLVDYQKVARKRFEKVVLNTNGSYLKKEHFENVDFVNISRHHFLDSENEKIFHTATVPSTERLKELCSFGDVTFNCVLPDKYSDKEFVYNYIGYAKSIGAKVAFRKYFNNLAVLQNIDTDETLYYEHSCPSCKHRKHIINGVDVTFKYSVKETHEHMNGIYELITQPNGDLTFDWEGKKILKYKEKCNVDI